MSNKKHTYLVTLTREVLHSAPDGTTVRATEHADVVIHSDTELAHEVQTGYTITGDWKLSIEPEDGEQ